MFHLKNKVIYIISQEDWGGMFLSKSHYAIELAKRGNIVYFLNHPDQNHKLKRGDIQIEKTTYSNLFVVKHRMWIPYFFKYRYPTLYIFLVRFHISYLRRKINHNPDLIWSFDLSNSLPISCFKKVNRTLFMPVDSPFWGYSIEAAKGADIIVSVTQEILDKYHEYSVPKHFINHGVSETFINTPKDVKVNTPIKVGYSGGLLRKEIDRPILLELISRNPAINFEFWGEYDYKNSFINLEKNKDIETVNFINKLKSYHNVKLHGVVHPDELSNCLKDVDILLIIYDILKDQSGGTNYHKVLEYLATGNVIISNNISTYSKFYPDMIQMIEDRESNSGMLELFQSVVNNIKEHNSLQNRVQRINFAKFFLYTKQVDKIENLLSNI